MKPLYFVFFLVIAFLTYNIQCFAQNDSINYDSLATLPLKDILELNVKGVSKYEEASEKSPASVIIITESQIKENAYQDLSDVLKNVLAIDIVDNARGFGEFYILRGIEGNDRFLVTIDGQKINPVSGTFLSIGNSISVKFAERIEIIFGPSSVMYGADAFSGIINIVSKDVENKYTISANTDYGSMNTINGEIAAQFKINKNLSFSGYARYFQSDGSDLVGRDSVYDIINQYKYPQRNKFEQPINDHTVLLKTKYKDFTLSYFRQHFNEGNALGMTLNSYIYNRENKWDLDNNLVWLNYHNQIGEFRNLSFNIALVNQSINPETQFYKWYRGEILEQDFSQYMTGLDNALRGDLTFNTRLLKQKNLKLIAGIEYEFIKSIPPYANDQVFARPDKFEGETAEIIKNELCIIEKRVAGFAQISYSPVKKMDVVFGGRYDYSIRYKETFNPRMSFVYTPYKNTVLKLMYGTAFQAPSLFYQYEQWGAATAVMLSAHEINATEPGWKLQNQKVKTSELAISHRVGDIIVFNLAVFHSHLTNLIERVVYTDSAYNKYFSTSDSVFYSPGIRNEGVGNQHISGVDFKSEISLKKDFYAYVSYSYIDAFADKETGKENIPRIAKHKTWFGLIYRNLFNHLNISTQAKWIGKINNRNELAFPSGKQPGYFNMDISLRVTNFIKPLIFYVKLENIFNNEYNHGGLLDQVVYLPTIPQDGFTIRAGIEFIINKK
ncbi:MAG: TonB-dependent receptor [Bacteroidota bacterium]